jgi:N-acetylmuramoyl-L-alanine amidase
VKKGEIYMSIKICLDAGHDGKYNQSNVVPAYYESDFNWKLYIKLKQYLEEYGIEVTGTRDNQNVEMGTKTRGRYSKGHNAFFSLHANWADRESADHVVIYEMLTKK